MALRPKTRPRDVASPRLLQGRALSIVLALACLLTGCFDGDDESIDVVIGVGSTIEQQVLAELAVQSLAAAGLTTTTVTEIGDTVALRRAARAGEIDLYFDYTGAAWTLGLGRAAPPTDPAESIEAVAAADIEEGLRWLMPSRVNATLAIMVTEDEWPGDDAATLSWLAGRLSAGEGALCADPDYINRPSGFAALAETYAIATTEDVTRPVGVDEAIAEVVEGDCLAALAPATSGEAVLAGLRPVADDQRVFPAFVIAPVLRIDEDEDAAHQAELADRVAEALAKVTDSLTTRDLATLNAAVEAGEEPASAAGRFLADRTQ